MNALTAIVNAMYASADDFGKRLIRCAVEGYNAQMAEINGDKRPEREDAPAHQ